MNEEMEKLCEELGKFCEDEHLPEMSAGELILEPGITNSQRAWLYDFCERWEIAEDAED